MLYNIENRKIWIAGHKGMVGNALVRRLENENVTLLTATREECDLTQKEKVDSWLNENKPDAIILAAAKVGGIHANNTYPADFLFENLSIQNNVIHGAYTNNVKKLLFLGSSCIYPKQAPQPLKEEYLLTGSLEPTNEAYALAKLSGIKLCQSYRKQYDCDFISCIPTNLYGVGDNYSGDNAHLPAALIESLHNAKINNEPEITIWGSGKPLREFLDVDELADACIFLLQNYSGLEPINIGSGKELSVNDFAKLVAEIIGYEGAIKNDSSKPDGTPRKRLELAKMNGLGWRAKTNLKEGLKKAYIDYLENNGGQTGIRTLEGL